MPHPPAGRRRRNSLRYSGYDYTQPGAYFVTMCTDKGRSIFGTIVNQSAVLNPLGQIAEQAWYALAARHATIRVDTFVIMPNHVHVLLWIDRKEDGGKSDGPMRAFGLSTSGSLSTIISAYKSSVTLQAKHAQLMPSPRLWQRNFYDHIVRNDADLVRIQEYITNNPARWTTDRFHPDAAPNRYNRIWRRE